MTDTPVDKGISDAKLADLVTLHERQRAMHAERHEIKAACAVDDIISALRELQEMREADRHFTELEHQLIAKAQMFRKERDVLKFSLTARDEALASIRVFAQDCIENGYFDKGSLGNLYSIRDLCDLNTTVKEELK